MNPSNLPDIPVLPEATSLPGEIGVHDALKRHEIHVLREAGFTLKQVADRAQVGVRTVQRVLEEPPVTDPETVPRSSDARSAGRPKVAIKFQDDARRILEGEAGLPTVEVLRRLRLKGYTAGKDPVYRLVADLRKQVRVPLVRFEGLAGEFSQHDFGSVRVRYDDGRREVLHFYASRLKWSRWMYVEIVANERVEALTRAHLRGLQSFGGVPLMCVFDNPKTVVVKRGRAWGEGIEWNPVFGQVALDYRFGVELCTPRRGQEKGSVENLVGFVKKNFFLVRPFHDRDDVLRQLPGWLHEVNLVRPCRATGVTPASRILEERGRLRPLPVVPAEYALRFPIQVGPTGWVHFEGVRYSMPAPCLHLPGTLYLYEDRVRIASGRFEVPHPRYPPNGISTLSAHATEGLAAVHGRRSKLYYQRQRLLELGPVGESYLTELVHARPRVWAADVERLFQVLVERGPERLSWALQAALDRGQVGSEHVLSHLRPEAVFPG